MGHLVITKKKRSPNIDYICASISTIIFIVSVVLLGVYLTNDAVGVYVIIMVFMVFSCPSMFFSFLFGTFKRKER